MSFRARKFLVPLLLALASCAVDETPHPTSGIYRENSTLGFTSAGHALECCWCQEDGINTLHPVSAAAPCDGTAGGTTCRRVRVESNACVLAQIVRTVDGMQCQPRAVKFHDGDLQGEIVPPSGFDSPCSGFGGQISAPTGRADETAAVPMAAANADTSGAADNACFCRRDTEHSGMCQLFRKSAEGEQLLDAQVMERPEDGCTRASCSQLFRSGNGQSCGALYAEEA